MLTKLSSAPCCKHSANNSNKGLFTARARRHSTHLILRTLKINSNISFTSIFIPTHFCVRADNSVLDYYKLTTDRNE